MATTTSPGTTSLTPLQGANGIPWVPRTVPTSRDLALCVWRVTGLQRDTAFSIDHGYGRHCPQWLPVRITAPCASSMRSRRRSRLRLPGICGMRWQVRGRCPPGRKQRPQASPRQPPRAVRRSGHHRCPRVRQGTGHRGKRSWPGARWSACQAQGRHRPARVKRSRPRGLWHLAHPHADVRTLHAVH